MASFHDSDLALRVRPTPRAGYRLEVLDGELLLYHPVESRVVYCNDTAALVWRLCDGRRTVGDIVALLANAFPAAAHRIDDDVAGVIRHLELALVLTR